MGNQIKAAEFAKGDMVWIERPVWIDGKRTSERSVSIQASVMGQIGNWVMVRYPRCMPFVESAADLRKWNSGAIPEFKPEH